MPYNILAKSGFRKLFWLPNKAKWLKIEMLQHKYMIEDFLFVEFS